MELREEKRALVTKQESLEAEIQKLQKQIINRMHMTKPIASIEVQQQSSKQDSEELENRINPVETIDHIVSQQRQVTCLVVREVSLNVHGEDLTTAACKAEYKIHTH